MDLTGKVCLSILLLVLAMSAASAYLVPYDPEAIDLDSLRQPPSLRHLFGTDNKGRDILARTMYGGKISIGISVSAAFISISVGLLYGLVSGYAGKRVDMLMTAFIDLILSFPSFLLAIAISVIFPPGIYTVLIALSAVGWASSARVIRGHILALKEAPFIEAARSIGCGHVRVLFVHLLPQCIPLAIVLAGLRTGGYILAEAGLGFLGLGAQPPTATWGGMISAYRVFINSSPWMVLFPGIMIVITVCCFNLLGDSLNDKYGIRR